MDMYKKYHFLNNEKWYVYDKEKDFYSLTEKATNKAKDSYEEYLDDLDYDKIHHSIYGFFDGKRLDPELNKYDEIIDESFSHHIYLKDTLSNILIDCVRFMNPYLASRIDPDELICRSWNNGLYAGLDTYPYMILIGVAMNPDFDYEFKMHPHTMFVYPDAFSTIKTSHTSNKFIHLKKLEFPRFLNCDTMFLKDLSVDKLFITGKGKDLYNYGYMYIIENQCIVSPKLELDKINNSYIKNLFVAGYLKYKEMFTDQEIINQYENYLNNNYEELLYNLNNDIIMNYIIINEVYRKIDSLKISLKYGDDNAKLLQTIKYQNEN